MYHQNNNQLQQQYKQNGEKVEQLSVISEMSLISHEIDKRINKKVQKVLELIQLILKSQIHRQEYINRMHEAASITTFDLVIIAKKLEKRQKFEHNPNAKDFVKMKNLQFPTLPRDLSE